MSTPRRTRLPPWYHRIRPSTWILLWLLLAAAIASLAMHAVSRRNALPRLVQVQVSNGSGVEGLAQHAAQRLRARGLDVVSTGDADASDYARTLDMALLQYAVLDGLLGIDAARLASGDALEYTADGAEALEAVASGRAPLAFLVNPTPVEQILAVADAGERMPQKSTFFYPKLATGLVMYHLG